MHHVAQQSLFVPGTAFPEVDGRKYSLIGHLSIKHDFRVTRALELFKDHFVHPAARFDQSRGYDG